MGVVKIEEYAIPGDPVGGYYLGGDMGESHYTELHLMKPSAVPEEEQGSENEEGECHLEKGRITGLG